MDKEPNKKKKWFFILLAILILAVLVFYFYTYFFAKNKNKVIYQDAQRRIYLTERKSYGNKGREMWRMVYEDQKTGDRFFVLGNSKKGFDEKKMSQIVLNTVEQKKMKSFDQVQGVGVTLRKATTDIHSNLIEKKGISDFIPELPEVEFSFMQ